MGTLVVRLKSKDELIRTGVLQKVDDNTEDEIGGTEYFTDVVGHRLGSSVLSVVLKCWKQDDDINDGDLWITPDGYYIHKDWLDGFEVVDNKFIVYDGQTYTMMLNKSKAKRCSICGCKTTNEHNYCDSCFVDKFTYINQYSHKPTPTFFGEQIDSDKTNPVWYGIELEHSSKSRNNVAEFAYRYNKDERFYFKSDSSIRYSAFPIEMVTHPHSFKELMSCEWVNNLHELDVVDDAETHEKNGCHVHISSTAFCDDAHYSKWYFFIYSLANGILQRIANRELTPYCRAVKYDNIITKTLAPKSYDRLVIINERNTHTKEVRVFSTTIEPKVLKSYIQFLESTIKYSKYAKKSVCYDDYIAYIFKYNTKYQELVDVVNGIDATKKPRAIVVPTETGEADSIFDVPSQYLHLITWVCMNAGTEHKVQSLTVDFISENIRVNGSTFSFDDIRGIKYAY